MAAVSPFVALYLRNVDLVSADGMITADSFALISLATSLIAFRLFRVSSTIPRYISAGDVLNLAKAVVAGEAGPKKLGADHVINVEKEDPLARIMEITGRKGVDVVLEMAGHPDSIRTAFDIVRRGGRISLLGLTSKPISLNFSEDIIFKGITIQGINGRRMYQTWYQMTALLKAGKLDLHPVITDRIAMKDFSKGMERLKTGEASKILVYPNGAK